MKRNQFIASFLTIAAAPFLLLSQRQKPMLINAKGFIVKAGEGRKHGHIVLKGINSNILDMKISGNDTNGDLAMFEQISHTQRRGAPLHIHHFQDEVFYVLEGAYYFQVGKEKYKLNSGDSIFLPRKVPHSWVQASEKGKLSVIFQPAGKMESFFLAVAALDHDPTAQEIDKIFSDHEMQVVGPPLQL
ncbi:quercetin dioxygenase-like cupin family protein [Pedobacter sp. CG_S7]|uniref:cupin domain-containing protein n=1 Tax=Pedobacter sp. CG_S7 TaxID=3143930 RepID=UPI003390AF17